MHSAVTSKLKLLRWAFCFLVFTGSFCGLKGQSGGQHSLRFQVIPLYQSKPLVLDEFSITNSVGQRLSITRLDFLLSDFEFRDTGGAWLRVTNSFAYINVGEQRLNFDLSAIQAGHYDRIRFRVGLNPDVNHGNPAQYAADHPLNPNLNGLHWNWANGYVFFAVEGHWRGKGDKESGYSYHLGNDPMLMTVELPLALTLDGKGSIKLAIDLDGMFDFELDDESSSTHSRPGDDVAERLRQRVEKAFTVLAARSNLAANKASSPAETQLPPGTTPYRFTFSSQFPIPDLPRDNPITEEGVELGRQLFFDKLLSRNNTQSCATCHDPEKAFVDSRRFSLGAGGEKGTRNSMPIFNLAWKKSFFWDGRSPTLRHQVLEPIQNPIEMHETLGNVIEKLVVTNYPALFARAFGSGEITSDCIAKALEQFVLTQLSFDSKFDRAMEGKVELTEEEKRGFELFITEYDPRREQFGADCFHCHGGPFFTTHGFANNGLDADFKDLGRYLVTTNQSDKGKFSVPSLRNVEITGPYMHDGRFKTLEEVIDHYTAGVKRSPTLDPNLAKHPDNGVPLNDADKSALVAFLKTLTDEKFKASSAVAQQARGK